MINKDIFLFKKNTEAIATNRGFYYQYLITLNNWIDLYLSNSNAKIFCELEDDIYELDKKNKKQSFTQVKAYSEGFRFNSPEIKKTLLNFFMLFLQYKDEYNGNFSFHTNAGTKINAGKFLKNWEENQTNISYVQKHFLEDTRILLHKYILSERSKKEKNITDTATLLKINNSYDQLKKYLLSDLLKTFVTRIRWTFLDVSTKEAIDIIITEISKKIEKLPNYGNLKKLIFARLLSEVYTRSTKEKENERQLDKQLIDDILKESKDEIESNIHASIETLKDSNFKILDEIDKIKNLVSKSYEIIQEEFGEKFSFNTFIENYRKNAIKQLSRVNFIGLQIPRGLHQSHYLNINEIYVNPIFQKLKLRKKNDICKEDIPSNDKEIPYEEILSNDNHIVILGGAGVGKSMFVKSMICNILGNKDTTSTKEINHRLPFRIELRKYLANKKENKDNILKFLKRELEDIYYIPKITIKQIELIISTYPTLFFFDGLDEIFDLSNKDEVRLNIEQFTQTYPNVRSVVTSRIDGYNEAKLSDEYSEFKIIDFSPDQVKDYLDKWYLHYLPGDENQSSRTNEINAFFEEIEQEQVDDELIKNPLLLSLILILYSNLKTIPQSKYQIYESCTNTLVDKWDKIKKIDIDIESDLLRYKPSIFSDLAFWEYEQLSKKDGRLLLTHTNAIDKVVSAILRLDLTKDYLIAKKWAEDFLEYAEKRSIYFDNEFTHKTFREFYTALWIYTNYYVKHKVDKLNEIISKYIDNSFWYIVLELLISMIDERQADNDIMDELLEIQIKNNKALPFILDILPKLKHVSKSKRDEIIDTAIITAIKDAECIDRGFRTTNDFPMSSIIFISIQKLAFSPSYFSIIENVFNELFKRIKSDEDLIHKYLSFYYELFETLPLRYRYKRVKVFKLSDEDNLSQYSNKFLNTYYYSKKLNNKVLELSDYLDIVKRFGKDSVFSNIPTFYRPTRRISLSEHVKHLLWYSPNDFVKILTEFKSLEVDIIEFAKPNRRFRSRDGQGVINEQLKVYYKLD